MIILGGVIYEKYLACILVCVMILSSTTHVYAVENGTQNMDVIVEDEEKNRQIDQLLSERCELELEYEKNIVRINQIDKQLEFLGVEEITMDEVNQKVGQRVMPRYSVSSTSTTKWTSRRMVVVYTNKQYELQIIEGVPIAQNSPLRNDYTHVQYSKEGFVAGAVDAIKVVGVSALGFAPEIGTVLSVGITAYDAFNAFIDNLTTSTIIENVEGTAVVSFTSHMKYVFVKSNGSTDAGNQVLCYVGNMVDYLVTTVSVVDTMVNGVSSPTHSIEVSRQDSSTSKYYSNYNVAAQNFYNYKMYGDSDFIDDYRIVYVTLSLFGEDSQFAVPSEFPNISN